jgi:hypothetical protein
MADLYFTDDGDFAVASNGDIAVTPTSQEQIRQQAQLRMVTQKPDFIPYPLIGADLQRLIGMPQRPETASLGSRLIKKALEYDSFVTGETVTPVPTDYNKITFTIRIPHGKRESVNLVLEQLLLP